MEKTKNNAANAKAVESTEQTVVAEVSHQNIGEAFLAIMDEVGYVQKKGSLKVNGKEQYKFAGERQLIEALRPALLKHKVICIPSEAKSRDSVVVSQDGKKTFRTVIDYTFVYTHVPSHTHIQVAVTGEGVDFGDKSAYKAATGALKYALRQPFLIETGDEPESDETTHEAYEDKKKEKNPPTNGEKTAQQEFGTSVEFKKYYNETMSAIERLPSKDHAQVIWARIRRLENVDEQYAQNATDALQLKLDDLHLQTVGA